MDKGGEKLIVYGDPYPIDRTEKEKLGSEKRKYEEREFVFYQRRCMSYEVVNRQKKGSD